MYTKEDLKEFKRRKIKPEQIDKQIENFKKGFEFVNLVEPATLNNGIKSVPTEEENYLIDLYEKGSQKADVIKMVPASDPRPVCLKSFSRSWKPIKVKRKNS